MSWIINTYWPEVRGNVYAIVPCGIVAFLWLRSRHLTILAAHESLKAAHVGHADKLDRLLDKLDSGTDGGISRVLDKLDENTPGGVGTVHERVRVIEAKIDSQAHDLKVVRKAK